MLKTLKKKFILTNMILVGTLLACVLVIFCFNTYNVQMKEIERALNQPLLGPQEEKEDSFAMMSYVVAIIDTDGDIVTSFYRGTCLDEESLAQAIENSESRSEEEGLLKSEKLFYSKVDTSQLNSRTSNEYEAIVFVDASRFISIMQKTIVTSIVIFFGAMLFVLLISYLIAKQAINPIQESWDRQKQFVADASHELKTPITVILANSGILKDSKDETIESEMQWIDSTEAEALHMQKLVQDMLFLAKNDNEADIAMSQIKSEIDLSEMAELEALSFEPLAYEKGMRLKSDIAEDVKINGNSTQIKQLFHILLDNAIKYAEPLGDEAPCIEVTLKKSAHPALIVKNTGKMIEAEEVSHFFDRFYRADKSRTRSDINTGGYGLGLAIAKAIAEKHGATISAKSGMTAGPDGSEGTQLAITF